MMNEEIKTRRGSTFTVISAKKAQKLSQVGYLDRDFNDYLTNNYEVNELDKDAMSNQTLSEVLSKNVSFQRISGTSKN